jgi:Family of unknown function (DUF6522)
MKLERIETGFAIDAADLGGLLGIPPDAVQRMMREGSITTRFERGVDEDWGRYRLTFFSRERRVQLIVDEAGQVLQRSRVSRSAPQAGGER